MKIIARMDNREGYNIYVLRWISCGRSMIQIIEATETEAKEHRDNIVSCIKPKFIQLRRERDWPA